MKFVRAYVYGLLAVFTTLLGAAQAQTSIKNDPVLQSAIARQNWEPGGKYFGSTTQVRGQLDASSRSGTVSILPSSSVNIGSFSLQSATITGNYGYVLRFSDHPYTEHAPSESRTTSSDSAKNQRPDGTQTSYSLNWTKTLTHPADGYDGVQGGGYPVPAGARDNYNYTINGIATGTYLVSSSDSQKLEAPGFLDRVGAYGNHTVENIARGWNITYGGGANLINGSGWKEKLGGAADTINGAGRIVFSGLAGAIQGLAGPELSQLINASSDYSVINGFNSLNIQNQFQSLASFVSTGEWLAENSFVAKTAEASINLFLAGEGSLGKGFINQTGESALQGTIKGGVFYQLVDNLVISAEKGFINATKVAQGAKIAAETSQELELVSQISLGLDTTGKLTEDLLRSMARRSGSKVLPGSKYGVDSGFDLVLKNTDGSITIVEAKQIKNGAIQLSPNGAGGNVQMSQDWINTVIGRLPEGDAKIALINQIQNSGIINTVVGGVDRTTGTVVIVPIKP